MVGDLCSFAVARPGSADIGFALRARRPVSPSLERPAMNHLPDSNDTADLPMPPNNEPPADGSGLIDRVRGVLNNTETTYTHAAERLEA